MEHATGSLLASVKVLTRQPAGTVTVCQDNAPPVSCKVTPPFTELVAAAHATGAPVPATLIVDGGQPRAILLRALNSKDDMALVLDAGAINEQLEPVIENLVNQIAHDVRNHVFSVGLQAELGARRAAPTPEVRAHFDAVLRQIDSLKSYIEKLLLYGRPVALSPVATDLESFLREQVQRYQFAWDQSGPPLSIGLETSGDPRQVALDQRALAIAFREILDNAARCMNPPPPIAVWLRYDPESVQIEIGDQGPGIPSATRDQLFLPMRVRRAGGAGLGLAIARKLVEAHGGSIELKSGSGGTTVRMTFPREVRTA